MQETPSSDGVFQVQGMKGLGRATEEELRAAREFNKAMEETHWGRSVTQDVVPIGGAIGNLVPEGFGESKYDTELNPIDLLSGEKTLDQLRAEKQSSLSKIAGGVGGALSLAGTTFARGTIGLLWGIGQGIQEGRPSALWDNDVTNALDSWDAYVDEQAPIYITKYEEEHPWRTVFSAGNLSNNLIKNAGFMIGAALSGQAYSGMFQSLGISEKIGSGVASINRATQTGNAARAGAELAKATMKTRAAGIGTQALVSTMSAIGEGSFEAANNSREYEEAQVQARQAEFQELISDPKVQRDIQREALSRVPIDNFTVITPEGQQIVDFEGHRQATQEAYDAIVNERWMDIRSQIHEEALKMGNADMMMNIPLLAISNWIQFGRLFRGGFKANKSVAGIKGDFARGFTTAGKNWDRARRLGKTILSPATEGFEEMNQSAVAEGASIWRARELDSFIADRYDKDAEEDTSGFFKSMWDGLVDTYADKDNWIEFVYGAMMGATPMPVVRRKSNGKLGVSANWEPLNKYRDSKESTREAQKLVDYLNQRVQSPKFEAEWNSMVANTSMQAKMNRTVTDPFNFKNYEHRQLVHDLVAIEKAGKLDLFKEQVQDWMSQPNDKNFIDDIKDATTDENGQSWMDNLTQEEIYETYQRNAQDLLNTIELFGQTSRNIRTTYGDIFSDDALDEMVYIRSQIDNWQSRIKALKNSLSTGVASSLMALSDNFTEEQKAFVNWLSDSSSNVPMLKEGDFNNIQTFINTAVDSSGIIDKDQAKRDLTDIARMSISLVNGIDTYNKHLSEPGKLNRKLAKEKEKKNEEVKTEEVQQKAKDVSQRIDDAVTLSELQDVLDSEDISDILANPSIEGSTKLGEAKKTITRANQVKKVAEKEASKGQDAVSRAAQDLIDNVLESAPSDPAVFDPESVQEVYGPELEAAYAQAEASIPQGLEDTFTDDVLDKVEAILSQAEGEYQKLMSAPDFVEPTEGEIEDDFDIPDDISLDGATPLSQPEEKIPQEQVDKPMASITVKGDMKLASSPTTRGSSASMIYTAVPEIHKEAAKFRERRNALIFPDNPQWIEWEKTYDPDRTPTDFSEIYQRLKEYGAFDYVRKNTIPVGTTVYFVADTGFQGANPEEWGYPIFLAIRDKKTKKIQIIGAAPSYKKTTVPLLKQVGESLAKSVAEKKTEGLVVSRRTTTVTAVNDGTFMGTSPKISTVSKDFIGDSKVSLGVVVDGQIYNNKGIVARDMLSSSISSFDRYNGRPVLLVKAPSGRYKLMPLRTAFFGTDIKITDTKNPIVREILKATDRLIDSGNDSEAEQAILDLKASLYLPGVYMRVAHDKLGGRTLIFKEQQGDGTYTETLRPVLINEAVPLGGKSSVDRNSVKDNILRALSSFNPKFQVSVRLLEQNPRYEDYYLDSGVLYTDMDSPTIYGSWFVFDTQESKKEKAEVIKEALKNPDTVTFKGSVYTRTTEGWRDNTGNLVTDRRTANNIERAFNSGNNTIKTSIPTLNTFSVGVVSTRTSANNKENLTAPIKKEQIDLENKKKILTFETLEPEQQESLRRKDISAEDFNKLSEVEKERLIIC